MQRLFTVLACFLLCPFGLRAQYRFPDIVSQSQIPDSGSLTPGAMLAETQAQMKRDTASPGLWVPPADFSEVDQEPVVIAKKEPIYPEIALKEKREGRVWVKIWVDRSGVPRDVVVLKSSDTIFNKPATDAAWQFKFTPAYVKKTPVDVWVAVPFKFVVASTHDMENEPPAMRETMAAVRRFQESVNTVMSGAGLEKLKTCVDPSAYVINGSAFESLFEAAQGRDKARIFATEKNRKLSFTSLYINDESTSAYEVWKTENEGGGDPRFHTVIFQKSKGGNWMIRHWHTSK
jgi:TonB family protein